MHFDKGLGICSLVALVMDSSLVVAVVVVSCLEGLIVLTLLVIESLCTLDMVVYKFLLCRPAPCCFFDNSQLVVELEERGPVDVSGIDDWNTMLKDLSLN